MENRKITIVQTKNQKKSVIMSSATTLSELKDDLRANGIDYSGMTFYEGLSKTELKTDESILPHDIERNGVITNELVFMLTNTEKKIKSGSMSRAEIYSAIKSQGLQDECVKVFGRNFTQCSTENLISLIESSKPKTFKAPEVVSEATSNEVHCTHCCEYNKLKEALDKVVEILYGADIINEYELEDIDNILESCTVPVISESKNEEDNSPYSDDEINQMFRGMR